MCKISTFYMKNNTQQLQTHDKATDSRQSRTDEEMAKEAEIFRGLFHS